MILLEKYNRYPILICFIGLVFSIKIFSIGIILLFLYTLYFNRNDYTALLIFIRNKKIIFILFFYLLHVLGLTYSTNLKAGFFTLEKMFSLLLLPVLFSTFSPFKKKEITTILSIFTLSIFVACILLYLNFFIEYINSSTFSIESISNFAKNYNRERLSSSSLVKFHHPYLGMLISTSLLFILHNFKYIKFNKAYIFIAAFFILFLVHLEAKMSLIALGITLMMFVALKLKIYSSKIFVSFIILVILTIGASVLFVPDLLKKGAEKLVYSDGGSRVRNWESAVLAIKDAPIFGYGTGDVLEALQKHRPKGSWEFEQKYNSHNQFLDIPLRLGIIGLTYWLFLLSYLMWTSYKEKKYFFTLFFILFAICSLTEVLLARFHGVAIFSLILSIFVNTAGEKEEIHHSTTVSKAFIY